MRGDPSTVPRKPPILPGKHGCTSQNTNPDEFACSSTNPDVDSAALSDADSTLDRVERSEHSALPDVEFSADQAAQLGNLVSWDYR